MVGVIPLLIPDFANFTMFRTFRVFRPLRTLGKVPGMKAIINTMLEAFDPLMNVVMLTMFIFFVFSVLGMELFQVRVPSNGHVIHTTGLEPALSRACVLARMRVLSPPSPPHPAPPDPLLLSHLATAILRARAATYALTSGMWT